VIDQTGLRILLTSVLATAAIVLLDVSGALTAWKEQSLDLAQQYLPRDAAPMSDEIVLVDIDDRALERIGRWPWPRTELAGVLDELHLAGARTIAIDLDLADPQPPTWQPGPTPIRIDHDAALAGAMSGRVVLAALLMPDELPQRWRAAGGAPDTLLKVLNDLQDDLGMDPMESPSITNRSDRMAAQDTAHLLRRHAVHAAAAETPHRDALAERAGHERGALAPIINLALRQHAARNALKGAMEHGATAPPSAGDRFPQSAFSTAAGGTGYVNIVRRSRDGGIRQIVTDQSIGHGQRVLPLGLAAVHAFRGGMEPITIDEDVLSVAGVRLPVTDGAVTVTWPRSETGMAWPDLHRATAEDGRFKGHLSIGEIAELARARRSRDEALATLEETSRELLRSIRQETHLESDNWLSEDLQREIDDEVTFSLGDISTRDALRQAAAGLNETDRNLLHRMLDWRNATTTATLANDRIRRTAATLKSLVDDRLVFIGWTATGTVADFVPTAAGPRTPGVMVHAALADMVLQDRWLLEGPRWWSVLASAILGLIVALIVAAAGPWPATAASLLVLIGWCGLMVASLATTSIVLPTVAPIMAITGSWAAGTGARAVIVQRDKRRITRQFRARVPEALVDELARHPESVHMRGVRREVCVMFGDLAGFTSISERLDSEQTVSMLNDCMAGLTDCLREHGAYVNKFLGDGFLAFWSAFAPQAEQARLACGAAMACQSFMESINRSAPMDQPPLGLRIGIATGEAIVGDCGAPPRLNDYTVIGDVANLAARLESANKQLGTSVLLDDRTRSLAGSATPLIEVGPLQVVGRDGVVDVWTVTSDQVDQAALEASSSLAQAVRSGDRPAARRALEMLERTSPEPGRLRVFRELVLDSPDPMPRAIRLREK